MPGFCICEHDTKFWLCLLNMAEKCLNKLFWLWQDSEYACSKFDRVLNMSLVLSRARARNMARFWICKGYMGCWISLTKLDYALVMMDILEYVCIYQNKQSSEYAKILNVSDAVHSIRLLCKSLSIYRDKHIQNTVKNSRIVPECRCTFSFGGQGKFCETMALW